MQHENITNQVIASAIEVHRALGPGLLESAYRACLRYELTSRRLRVDSEVTLPVAYRGIILDCGYRVDMVVDNVVVVELKVVESLAPIHTAQVLTCLKLSGLEVGLLLNFHVPLLRHGIRRIVLTPRPPSSVVE